MNELTIGYIARKIVKDRLKENQDLVVAVCADEGDGKSSLAIQLAMEADKGFDLENNVLYSPKYEEMNNKIRGLPRYAAIVADEAISVLYKMNWMSKAQKYIKILYAKCRQENKLSILCIPRMSDLDEYFRAHRVRVWIQIIDPISLTKKEGHAIIMAKSWNFYSRDPWHYKEMQKAIDTYARRIRKKEVEFSIQDRINVLKRSRNFIGVVKFGHLDDEIFKEYSKLKAEHSYDETMHDEEEKVGKRQLKNMFRENYYIKKLKSLGITQKEMANDLKESEPTFSERLSKISAKLGLSS